MKFEISNILVGVSLFCTGALIGNNLHYPSKKILSIEKIISVVGLVATICIGLKALDTWKSQFRHNEQYKAALKLEGAFREYLNAFVKFRSKHLKMSKAGANHEELYASSERKHQNDCHYRYLESWSYITAHLSKDTEKNFKFTPKSIEKKCIELLNPLHKISSNEYIQEHDPFYTEVESFWNQGIREIRKIREKS